MEKVNYKYGNRNILIINILMILCIQNIEGQELKYEYKNFTGKVYQDEIRLGLNELTKISAPYLLANKEFEDAFKFRVLGYTFGASGLILTGFLVSQINSSDNTNPFLIGMGLGAIGMNLILINKSNKKIKNGVELYNENLDSRTGLLSDLQLNLGVGNSGLKLTLILN